MASLAVCATKAEAENQFEELLQFVQEALQFLPCFRLLFLPSDIVLLIALGVLCSSFFLLCRLEEQGLARCSKSDLRRVRFISCANNRKLKQISLQVSVLVSGKEMMEVGSVALQGDYFSKRLMIRQKTGPDSLQPLYTASMHLSITRLLACILEISQGDVERLSDFKSLLI